MSEIKLHLGCGSKIIPGYTNIDIAPRDGVVVCDISKLPYDENSVDLIYSCANIEHFGRNGRSSTRMSDWKNVVKHWAYILKPGGILRLSTADFEAVCNRYSENKNIEELFGFVVGGQKDFYDYHGMIFDFDFMKKNLEDVGFSNIRRYDFKDTDIFHLGIDDYSQSFLPHMDKDNGRLMMLNVEATKV